MSMKEVWTLAQKCYFDLTPENMKKIADAVDAYAWKARKEDTEFHVQHSFSSEGGIAVDYLNLGLPPGFGEWLHLRYHKRLKFFNDEKSYHMSWHFNMKKGLKDISRNKQAKEAVIKGMNMLLDFVEKVTGKPRDPHKCY